MNTSKIVINKIMTVSTLVLLVSSLLFGESPARQDAIAKRITHMNTVVDVRLTDEVMTQVSSLVLERRRDAETVLGRSQMFFPMIEQKLRDKNLPDALKYISVIESSLIPFIESRQGATGIWQFMKGTAELYDLKVEKYFDERMDVEKSTDKALDYLKKLHKKYNDWTLALAAYNCGDGTIDRAMKKAGGNVDYWELQKYLPTETKKYIPRFIAAQYLFTYYYEHELTPRQPSDLLTKVATIKVYDKVDFKKLSKELELDIDYIRFLNPIYRKEVIPQKDGEYYTLTLPMQMMYTYIDKYNSFDNLLTPLEYTMVDENPIAQTDRNPEEVIMEIRQIQSINQLRQSRKSNITQRDSFKDEIMMLGKNMEYVDQDKVKLYRLRRKESLSDVAQANNMSLKTLMDINGIKEDEEVGPGSIIKLCK
jgi:membrane-bound lytic murein transglycosylase D